MWPWAWCSSAWGPWPGWAFCDGAVRKRVLVLGLSVLAMSATATVALSVLGPGATATARGVARAASASATPPLTLGFSSDQWLVGGSTASRAPWIARAVKDGASTIRVDVRWDEIAPAERSAGFVAADPASPGYNWTWLDGVLKDLSAHGLGACLTLYSAPAWAQAPGRPESFPEGTWRPSASQFAKFATAAARRYDGTFPDPTAAGSFLPHVRCWQAWNEPNIDFYLSPQWVRSGHTFKPVSPGLYRGLLNAFYHAIKAVSSSDFVLMAGTAPFGTTPGTLPSGFERTAPVAFYRDLFCLRGPQALKPYRCPAVYLDGIDHHPFAPAGPTWHAVNPDDVAVADVHKIVHVLRAAVSDGHVLPRGPKKVWITEVAWSSNPPNAHGVPVATDARWYEQAMYVLWRQGVRTVMSLELGDPPNISNQSTVFESGLYYSDGKPKPIAKAYRFPFVVHTLGAGRVEIWGRSPQAGKLEIQRREKGSWQVIRTLRVDQWQVFSIALAFSGNATWRASVGSLRSLSWTQGRYTRG